MIFKKEECFYDFKIKTNTSQIHLNGNNFFLLEIFSSNFVNYITKIGHLIFSAKLSKKCQNHICVSAWFVCTLCMETDILIFSYF